MILKKLHLKNFKSFEDATFEFGKNKTGVYGTNATGKSTLVDAFYWFLYGKDRKGRSDYDIKTRKDNNVLHNLEHSVTGFFDGVSLSRTYREKWERKRGDTSPTFTGHETIYTVDGDVVPKGLYDAKVTEMFGAYEDFRTLSDPLYFAETLDWKKRRAKVMEIAGEATNADVAASDPKRFNKAMILIKNDDIEATIASLETKKRTINKELATLQIRIDEANEGLKQCGEQPDEEPIDLVNKVKALEDKIQTITDNIANLNAGGDGNAETRKEISNLSVALQHEVDKRKQKDRVAKEEYENKKFRLESSIKSKKFALQEAHQEIASTTDALNELRREYAEIRQDEFEELPNCFNCGQPLPPEAIEAERGNWNQQRAKLLKENKDRGIAKKMQRDSFIQQAKETEAAISELEKELYSMAPPDPLPVSSQESELESRIKTLEASINEVSNKDKVEALESNRNALRAQHTKYNDRLSEYRSAKKQRERIEELTNKQTDAADAFQSLVADIQLLESFFVAKLDMIEDSVFETFGVRFQMFNRLINGGIEPCCDVMIDCKEGLVPFQSANDAARIITGLSIIENLSTRLNTWAPIFIDNAESVVSVFSDFKGQIVRLVVDQQHKNLTLVEE